MGRTTTRSKKTDEAVDDVARDAMDAGVPMVPGQPDEPIGPEDALGPGPKRGDYTDRLQSGPPMVTRVIPEDERHRRAQELADKSDGALTAGQCLGDVPKTELVPAGQEVADIGDAPGKGGVSTDAAREQAAATAHAADDTAGEDA